MAEKLNYSSINTSRNDQSSFFSVFKPNGNAGGNYKLNHDTSSKDLGELGIQLKKLNE